MKKYIRLSVLFLTAVFFTACNITVEEEYTISAPTCDIDAGTCVSISIKKSNSDTKYINLYRQDVTSESNPGDIISIGIIYPDNLPEESAVNTFKDFLVINGHDYKYYARIYDGQEYIKTKWSDTVKIPDSGCIEDTKKVKYNTANATFQMDTADYKITFTGTIDDPEIKDFNKEFKPAIIVKSSERTETFLLPTTTTETPWTLADVWSLRGILSIDFMDTEIEIVGICGQKEEMVEDSKTEKKRIIWTEPATLKVRGIENNKLTIPSAASTKGSDYSRQLNKN